MTVPAAPRSHTRQAKDWHYNEYESEDDDGLHERVNAVAEQLLQSLSFDSVDLADRCEYATPLTPNLIVGSPMFSFSMERSPTKPQKDSDQSEAPYDLWSGQPVLDHKPGMWGARPSIPAQ